MPGPLFVLHVLIKCFKNKLISKVPVMQQALRIKKLSLRSAGYAKVGPASLGQELSLRSAGYAKVAQHPLDRCSTSLGCPLSWGAEGRGIWGSEGRQVQGFSPFGQLLEYIASFRGPRRFSPPLDGELSTSPPPASSRPAATALHLPPSLPPFSFWDSQGLASQPLPSLSLKQRARQPLSSQFSLFLI